MPGMVATPSRMRASGTRAIMPRAWYCGSAGDAGDTHDWTGRHASGVECCLRVGERAGGDPGADDLVQLPVIGHAGLVVTEARVRGQFRLAQRRGQAGEHVLTVAAHGQPVAIAGLIDIGGRRLLKAVAHALTHDVGVRVLGQHAFG